MKKVQITQEKFDAIKRLSNENNIIAALAIDQRGSLKKMLSAYDNNDNSDDLIINYKKLVSEELTKYSSSILLDPEYGLLASKSRDENAGLLLAYEKTGYDATKSGRLPDLLEEWSVYRLKEAGADAIKFLLYYDIDEDSKINEYKHVFMERVGTECLALNMPFFLEIISYDRNINDSKSAEYAKMKPRKVIEAVKEFSKEKYHVDVLKLEVPVNMNYVEGYTTESTTAVYSQNEAAQYFKDLNNATHIPYIYLSAGVSMKLFKETLKFAKKSEAKFQGVLCGRATWKDSVEIFATSGVEETKRWLNKQGKENIESLNQVVNETATPWTDYYEIIEKN